MIALALRQLWREPRVTAVLLAAIALVTSFAALAPLYVRMVAAAELDVRMTSLTPRQQRLELNSETPLTGDVLAPIEAALGEIIQGTHRFAFGPTRHCNIGSPDRPNPRYTLCGRQYTYPDLASEFTVLEGRLPQPDDEVIEFVLESGVLDKSAQLDREFAFAVGERYRLHDGVGVVTLELVGIVEALIPGTDPRWDGQNVIFGAITIVMDNAPDELDVGLIVHPDMLASGFESSGPRQYVARAELALTDIRAADLDDLSLKLDAALSTVRMQNPTITVLSPVSLLISDFQARVAEVGGPVLLLVALTMVLLLYTLITTGALILDRARTAWAQMAGRGGSARQLIAVHTMGMGMLGVLAWLMSVPLALGFALALAILGPQAGVVRFPTLSDIPLESLMFSGGTAVIAVAALVLPGIPAAFTSFARLKSDAGRPASRPLWARYYADLILSGLGVLFVLRAQGTAGLTDPFSLAGPALLLTGAAMLWLRVFPLLMQLIGALLGGLNNLGVRLAFWSLERDPGSSGQLVMLVVGALALGTASLVLTQTRAQGTWDAARMPLAADALLTVDPAQMGSDFNYTQIPGITSASSQIAIDLGGTEGRPQAVLLGYTELDAPEIAWLNGIDYAAAGVPVPENATALEIDVYSETSTPQTEARITLEIANADQLRVQLPLTSPEPFAANSWVTHTASLDPGVVGRGPYRVTGILFPSLRPVEGDRFGGTGRFDHTLYVHGLRAFTEDGASVLADLARDPETLLTRPTDGADVRSSVLAFEADDNVLSPQGQPSLRVLYNRNTAIANRPPSLQLMAANAPIPVLITERFADNIGSRSALRRPLQAGDTLASEFPSPEDSSRRWRVEYEVIAIVPAPAPYTAGQSLLITRAEWLQSQLNQRRATLETGVGINRVRLSLDEQAPSPELRSALAALPGISTIDFAYDRFAALQRAPLANAVTGMLFAGFCAAFGLIVLQAGFYTAVMLRRRAGSFAVLRSLGWSSGHVLRMLAIEQAAIVVPAVLIGVLSGIGLAALLSPLLGEVSAALHIPFAQIIGLLATIAVLFGALLGWSASILRSTDVAQQIRTVD